MRLAVAEVLDALADKNRRNILLKLKEGKIDILFGTHKILNEKIDFKDLGLLVIDEEQRFGKIKKSRLDLRDTRKELYLL